MLSDRVRARLKALLTFHDTPHRLGLAFGLGITLGMLPGTGALAAAACATLLRLNLSLAVAGTFLMNPLTMVFVYGGSYALGRRLVGEAARIPWLGARIVLHTLVGNILLAVGLGLVGYLVVAGLVTAGRWRTRRARPSAEHAREVWRGSPSTLSGGSSGRNPRFRPGSEQLTVRKLRTTSRSPRG